MQSAEFYRELLKETGSALDEVRNEYYGLAEENIFSAIERVLTVQKLQQIERAARGDVTSMPSYRGGLHFCPTKGGWLPLAFINVEQLVEARLWDGFKAFLMHFGLEHHVSLAHYSTRRIPSRVKILVPPRSNSFIEEIDLEFREIGYLDYEKIKQNAPKHDNKVLDWLAETVVHISELTEGKWVPSEKAKAEWFAWIGTQPTLKLLASLYFTIQQSFSPNETQTAVFFNMPGVGGYAFVGKEAINDQLWDSVHKVFERILFTLALLHGKLSSEPRTLPSHLKVDESVQVKITPVIQDYLNSLQKPKADLRDSLHLDKCQPFRYVERIGHKEPVVAGRAKKLLLVRLAATSDKAVNFLYADNATIMNRLQGFLDGLLWQHQKEGTAKAESTLAEKANVTEAVLDVYVAPSVFDINTRVLSLYAPRRIQARARSVYWKWYKRVFAYEDEGDIEMPCVIYRFSETVGPSILVSEVTAIIAKHLVDAPKGGACPGATLPIRVLNLFSGTGSAELTLWNAFKTGDRDPSTFVSVLSLDLNPISLLSKKPPLENGVPEHQYKAECETIQSAMRVSHSVPTDIFGLLSNDPREAENIYLRKYDIITADPPHYLAMDFLFQRYPRTGEYLFKQLAEESNGVFILYFGHEEVEWMNFYIHWHLQNMGWPVIWNVLLGEERLILCFGRNSCVSQVECRRDLLRRLREVGKYYYGESARVEVYDTLMRKLEGRD